MAPDGYFAIVSATWKLPRSSPMLTRLLRSFLPATEYS
jgi:hypothetical protein